LEDKVIILYFYCVYRYGHTHFTELIFQQKLLIHLAGVFVWKYVILSVFVHVFSNQFCFVTNVLSNGYRTSSFYFVIQYYGVYFDTNSTDTTDVKWMFISVCSYHGLEAGVTPTPLKTQWLRHEHNGRLKASKTPWNLQRGIKWQLGQAGGPLCERSPRADSATLNIDK